MTTVVQRSSTAEAKSTREFIGRGWINTVKNGPKAGMQFINCQLDRGRNGIEKVELVNTANFRLQLWPNNKRPNSKDADYRVSIVS